MAKRFTYWIPAICVAALISTFSSHYFSSAETSRILTPILHWIFPAASAHILSRMHTVIRKLAHVTEFAAFSIAVFHGVRGERYGWRWQWALLTLLIAVSYSGLDEWHQSFVPVRDARVRDVFIDSAGALLAQIFVWGYAKFHRNSAHRAELRSKTL
ncbi:MAG TPA: VanZ family protein [Candidatus Limnocylindrales bacterium]|nr:VanZ family protein [Candidatus Limnocylindrales bacterium]